MSVYDKLFQLQLRLKQNKVNQQRKRDEVKRLCQSYENQIYHLLYLLYNFSNHTWYQLNEPEKILSNNTDSNNNNYSDIFLNISKIPVEPENKIKNNNNSNLSDELSQLSTDLKAFAQSHFNNNNSNSPFPFTIESFLLILTLFNFFWCQESSDLFTNFINELDPKDSMKFIQCLIIHPSIQMYFITALKPIFYQIQNAHESQNQNMNQALLDSLIEFSPLIPNFMKSIFKDLKIPNEEKPKLFYEIFLRNFILNFSTFGIFHPEIMIYHKDQIDTLINSLNDYFLKNDNLNKDQISPEKFIESLFSNSQSICIIPNEERLINVSKGYCPSTLVDKRSLEIVREHLVSDKKPDSPLAQIPLSPIFFVPHSSSPTNYSTHIASKFMSDSAVNIASRILLRSDLIHIEDTENKTQNDTQETQNDEKENENNNNNDDSENAIPVVCFESSSMKPFEYFEKIVDLSFARVADPQVEVDLDKLESLVQDMSLEELCQLIETELSMIEISSNNTNNDDNALFTNFDQDEDIISTLTSATSATDPLQRISLYSTQFSLINKISSFLNSQIKSSTTTAIFLLVNKYISNYIERVHPPKKIYESKEFYSYYETAFKEMMNLSSPSDETNNLANMSSVSAENLKINSPININNNDNSRLASSTTNLRDNLDSSKKWSNIQPDFVTHRNFHSCLSFKLGLFNEIKTEKEIIDEAEKMNKFLNDNKDKLIDYSQHKFLEIFVKEPQRLRYFNEEFKIAFSSNMPYVRIEHIHQAYQALIGLLQIQGMDEIGADQITPFAMTATVMLMTSMNSDFVYELTYTYTYLFRYINPFIAEYNVLNHPEEYSVIQFLSTYQYLYQYMKEMNK